MDSVSISITCAFNKRGTLLAVGCNDGRIMIWDFLTRGIAKVIIAHVHPVCSVRYDRFVNYYLTVSVMLKFGFSWSRDGRKLLSAATDNTVSIWDVVTSDCDKTFRFPSPILKVQFHPRDKYVLFLFSLMCC